MTELKVHDQVLRVSNRVIRGDRNIVLGDGNIVIGDNTVMRGNRGAVYGNKNTVVGDDCVAVGLENVTSGQRNHNHASVDECPDYYQSMVKEYTPEQFMFRDILKRLRVASFDRPVRTMVLSVGYDGEYMCIAYSGLHQRVILGMGSGDIPNFSVFSGCENAKLVLGVQKGTDHTGYDREKQIPEAVVVNYRNVEDLQPLAVRIMQRHNICIHELAHIETPGTQSWKLITFNFAVYEKYSTDHEYEKYWMST